MKQFLFVASLLLVLSIPVCAAVKLYLRDGSYQVVREYQVVSDRVRFYSTDRADWEEMPLDLVDLKKTEAEIKARQEAEREDAKSNAEEDKAERQAAREIRLVPADNGAYMVHNGAIVAMKVGEVKVVDNKRRNVLKALSPIPAVSGKSWLEMDGAHSQTVVTDPLQEFYIRLSEEERFGIIKMGERKGNRVLENITIIPVTKELIEEPTLVPIFHTQGGEMLYKIWPQKPLEPGEYAVVQYTEGKVNMQSWDFRFQPAAK